MASTPRKHKPVPAAGPGKRHVTVTATHTPTSLSASVNQTTCSVHCYLHFSISVAERTHSCIGRSQHRAHSNPQSLTPLLITSHAHTSGALETHSHHLCCRHTPSSLLRPPFKQSMSICCQDNQLISAYSLHFATVHTIHPKFYVIVVIFNTI